MLPHHLVDSHLGSGAEITVEVAREFIRKFVITYKSHGGRFRTDMPPIIIGQTDTGKAVMDIFKKTGDTCRISPHAAIVLEPDS